MIAHVRRVSLAVAFVVAAVSAWSTSTDAAPRAAAPDVAVAAQVAAAPQVTVTGAALSSTVDLEVYGTATCGQSGGQADLFVSGLQVLDFVYAATTATLTCGTGPVTWHVTLTTYPGWRSSDLVTANVILTDATGTATHSAGFYI